MIFIQRICIALSGFGVPIRVEIAMSVSALIEVDSWNLRSRTSVSRSAFAGTPTRYPRSDTYLTKFLML